MPRIWKFLTCCSFLLVTTLAVKSQVIVKGRVLDISKTGGIQAVSVLSTSGTGTVTDSMGNYAIRVGEKDSIWFSYLNKPTPKFAVASMQSTDQFDISLHVPSTTLKEVRVFSRSYKLDSIQNRRDYAKAFDFKKPGLGITSGPAGSGGAGVGLDLDQLINVFRFRRNRSMLGFQKRLVQEEEDKFIDHRFSKKIVSEITLLTGESLSTFMKLYRPTFEFTQYSSDYEFYEYIKSASLQFKAVNK